MIVVSYPDRERRAEAMRRRRGERDARLRALIADADRAEARSSRVRSGRERRRR